jgi:peptidoglycan/LPS O-acetylase OafA/YrhL
MKLGSVQFLRAIAALLVAYAHSIDVQENYASSFQQHFLHWENFGAFGLDIFFVISGFIIAFSAQRYRGGRDGMLFLQKRFLRVNPVYYLATLLYLGLHFSHTHSLKAIHVNADTIGKSILLLPFFDRTIWTNTILPVAWTLCFEWWFYILFAVTIFCRVRYKGLLLSALLLLPMIGCSFPQHVDFRLQFIGNPLMLEFLLGVGIYWCYTHVNISGAVAILLIVTGIGICLCEIFRGFGRISESQSILTATLSLTRFFLWGIPAGLLVAGCIFLEKNGRLVRLWNAPLTRLLGDASYSIYLIHLTIYGVCMAIYTRLGFFMHPDLAVLVQVLVGVGGGIIFYFLVEAPLLRLLRKRYSTSTSLSI